MMTKKQYRVFSYIERFISRAGASPTYNNIARVLQLKTDYEAYTYVERIIKQGYLRKTNTTPPLLEVIRCPTPEELASVAPGPTVDPTRGKIDRSLLSLQRGGDDAEKRERLAYNRGVADARARMPQTLVDAYERGVREGKRQNTVDLSKAYKDGYAAATADLTPLRRRVQSSGS